jgi:hypothetical protein
MVGSGILNDPYLITNASDWADINTYQGTRVYFKLVNDIDFNNQLITPLKNFMGYIDGNYKRIKYFKINNDTVNTGIFDTINGDMITHSIKDLEIYSGSLEYSFGIENFGFVAGIINSASISNVHVVQCKDFNGSISISTDFNFGFFAGKTIDSNIISSSVRNSEFDLSDINSYSGSDSFGGFVGKIDDSTINTCYSDNRFYNIVTSTIDNINIGGFVGHVTGSHAEILNCHVSSSLDITSYNSIISKIGGFVGNVQECELFENCYSNTWITTDATPISYVNGFAGYSADDNYNNCFYNMDRVPGGFNTSYVEISGRSDKQSNSIVRLPDSEMKLLENYTEIDNYYLNFAGDQALGFIRTGVLVDPYFDGNNLDGWVEELDTKETFQYVEPGTNGAYCVYFDVPGINSGIYLDLTSTMITGEYYIVKIRYKSTGHFNVEDYNGVIHKTFTPKGDWTYVEFRFQATSSKYIFIKFLQNSYYWIDSFYVEMDRNVDFNSVELIDSNVYNKVLELNGNDEYLLGETQSDLAGFDPSTITVGNAPTGWTFSGNYPTLTYVTNELGSVGCMKAVTDNAQEGVYKVSNFLTIGKQYKLTIRYRSPFGPIRIGHSTGNTAYGMLPASTEWNTISKTIIAVNTTFGIVSDSTWLSGTFYVESITITEDVKNELNSHQELIRHSKNRDFETSVYPNITTNSGYSGTTDWVDTNNDGLADTYTDMYAMEFNGTDEYLRRALPTNIAGFDLSALAHGSNSLPAGWAYYNISGTISTAEIGSVKCVTIPNVGFYRTIYMSSLTIGKKYKAVIRYKTTSTVGIGSVATGNRVYGELPSTTQWNTVTRTFVATTTTFCFVDIGTGITHIDSITLTEDWKLDLNESFELIKHSKNMDFETTLNPVYISNFTSGVDGFTTAYSVSASFNETIFGVSGCLKLTCVSGSTSNSVMKSNVFQPNKRYKYKASVYIPTSSVNVVNVSVYNGYQPSFTFASKGEWVTKEIEWTHYPSDGASNIYIGLNNAASKSVDDIAYIKDIMVYEMHNNLVINPTCAGTFVDGLAPNWSKAGDILTLEGTGYSSGKSQLFSSSVDWSNGNIRPGITSSLVANTKYRLSFTGKIQTVGVGSSIKITLGNISQTASLNTSEGVKYTLDFVPTTVTQNGIYIGANGAGHTSVYMIDDVSLNEIPEWSYTTTSNHVCNTSILDKNAGTSSLLITATGAGRIAEYTSDFSAGVDGWSNYSGFTLTGNQDGVVDLYGVSLDNCLKLTCNTTGTSLRIQKSLTLNNGNTYYISGWIWVPSTVSNFVLHGGNTVQDLVTLYATSNPPDYVKGRWVQFNKVGIASTSAHTTIQLYFSGIANGEVIYLKDVQVGSYFGQVSLPSANLETLVATNKYTLEGWAKTDVSSLTYGSNLVGDSGFDNPVYWTIGTAWSVTGSQAICNGSSTGTSGDGTILKGGLMSASKIYKLVFDVISCDSGASIWYYNYATPGYESINNLQIGTYTRYIVGASNNFIFRNGALGKAFTIDNFYLYEATPITLTKQIGTKNVTITPSISAFTKFVLNFEATASEVGADIKAWLSGVGNVWLDSVSLTQAYDYVIAWSDTVQDSGNDQVFMGAHSNTSSNNNGFFLYRYNIDNRLTMFVQDGAGYNAGIDFGIHNDNEKASFVYQLSRTGYKYSVKNNAVVNATNASVNIGKVIIANPLTVGRRADNGIQFFKGQISSIQILRFANIGLSNFNPTTYKIGQSIYGGGNETVLLLDWRDGSSFANAIKDYSSLNHPITNPGSTMDLENRVRIYGKGRNPEIGFTLNGVDESLQINRYTELITSNADMNSVTNSFSWTTSGTVTFGDTAELDRLNGVCKIVGVANQGIRKDSLVTVGKRYKLNMRYKSTVDLNFGNTSSNTAYKVFKSTTQWNTIEFSFNAVTNGNIVLFLAASGTVWIDNISIIQDLKFDLNDYERITHSKNTSGDIITVDSGSLPVLTEYALDFNGTDEYLYRPIPLNADIGLDANARNFTENSITAWTSSGTVATNITETGSSRTYITRLTNTAYVERIFPLIETGSQYKFSLRYKSTSGITISDGTTTYLSLPATTQWNSYQNVFSPSINKLRIAGTTTGTSDLDLFSFYKDWKLDLNSHTEYIKHSSDGDFEMLMGSDIMTNTGWTGTTDWTGSVDGLAAGISAREDYALEFDGSTEYLGIPLPADLAVFTPSTISGGNPPTGWSKSGVPTSIEYVTTESGSSGCAKLVLPTNTGIVKSMLTRNNKYKLSFRYKLTGGNIVRFASNNSVYSPDMLLQQTSEWNTITKVFTQPHTDTSFYIYNYSATTATLFIESLTIKDDQGFDLNKDQEMILHSKNWNFETTLSNTYTSNFSSGVDGWSNYVNTIVSGNVDNINGENDCLQVYVSSSASTPRIQRNVSGLVNGEKYLLKFKTYTTSSANVPYEVYAGNVLQTVASKTKITGSWQNHETEFLCTGTDASGLMEINFTGVPGDLWYLKDYNLYKIPNRVINGTFGSTSNWSLLNGTVITSSKMIISSSTSGTHAYQNGVLVPDRRYRLTYQVLDYVSGNIYPYLGGGAGVVRSANGLYTEDIMSLSDGGIGRFGFSISTVVTSSYSIDNVHIYEIPEWTSAGNHTANVSILDKNSGTSSLLITSTGAGSSGSNYVSVPYANLETLVAGNKYTLEGWAKTNPASLTYGSNLIPSASSNFSTDGSSYWSVGNAVAVWNSGSQDITVTCSTTSNHIVYKQIGVVGNTYRVTFRAKSSTHTDNIGVRQESSVTAGVIAIKNPILSTDYQDYEFILAQTIYAFVVIYLGNNQSGKVVTLDDINVQQVSSTYISAQIGTKSVLSSQLNPVSFTKFALNFLASSSEVNQDLKMYLNSSSNVFVDDISLTQAYDMWMSLKEKTPNSTGGQTVLMSKYGNNALVGYGLVINGANQYYSNINSLIGGTSTAIGFTKTSTEYSNIGLLVDRTFSKYSLYLAGVLKSNSSLTGVNLSKLVNDVQPFRIGALSYTAFQFITGSISHLQMWRFTNIDSSSFNSSSLGLQYPVGGGAEEVLRLTFQNGNSVSGMLRDYSPKNHNVVPSGSIDLTNRKRTTVTASVSTLIPIESASNKLFWLNPNKISVSAIDQWTMDEPTGSGNYFWNSPGSTAPETSSLNSIGVYTPTGTNYMRLTDASGYRFIPSGSNWTMFTVIKNTSGPAISKYDGGTNKLFYIGDGSALRFLIRDSAANDLDIITTANATNWQVLVTTYDNATKTLSAYVSGSSYTDTNVSYSNVGWEMTGARLFLNGQNNGTTATTFGTGTGIAEWVITTDKKSSSDINGIAGYLANKYGLTWTNI